MDDRFGNCVLVATIIAFAAGIAVLAAIIVMFPRKVFFLRPRAHVNPTEITVNTTTGVVRGTPLKVFNRTVFAFYGIPYAQPPLGSLRFAISRLNHPWKGVLDGFNSSPSRCPQMASEDYFGPNTDPSDDENCLLMNVYVPVSTVSGATKATILVLHGGDFQTGSNHDPLYDGRFLAAAGDVIVAVPNYRLNVFGFFRTERSNFPGNQGLWDQLVAIQWMNENAQAFGGRRGYLTVMGIDSGALSAGLHLLSPVSRQTVNRVIMQGGSPLLLGEFSTFAELQEQRSFAEAVCGNDSSMPSNLKRAPSAADVIDCLRYVSAGTLLDNLGEFNGIRGRLFGPSYGTNATDDELFISSTGTGNRSNIDESNIFDGKELLLGYTANEGEYYLKRFLRSWSLTSVNRYPRSFIRIFLDRLILHYFSMPRLSVVRDFYFGSRNTISNMDSYLQACTFLGDMNIKCPSKLMADYVSSSGGIVYVYELEYDMNDLLAAMRDVASSSKSTAWHGATHYADAIFSMGSLFRLEPEHINVASHFSRQIMAKWGAFARSGVPDRVYDVPWPTYTASSKMIAHLSLNKLRVKRIPREEECGVLVESSRFGRSTARA